MKLRNSLLASFIAIASIVNAQESTGFQSTSSDYLYATMDASQAENLQLMYPNQVKILQTHQNVAAVYLPESLTVAFENELHLHGPAYVRHFSALEAQDYLYKNTETREQVALFTITEQAIINQLLSKTNPTKIEETIIELENFGTRFHTSSQAIPAMEFILNKWQSIVDKSGRTDIHLSLYQHINTPMPSVILTIDGSENSNELVIIGGHADSITSNSYINPNSPAPGADDNASGIATITEVLRVLIENNFKPQKTIQIMAYSAEEVGLVGSKEIAAHYKNLGKKVLGYVQFDMTNYQGSENDLYLTTDSYIDNNLNLFLIELLEHYNSSNSPHPISFGFTKCNYACSDHESWARNGYAAAFPFESKFEDYNRNIHSVNDRYSVTGNSFQAEKFAKLGLQFLVEVAKSAQDMSTTSSSTKKFVTVVNNKNLLYRLPHNTSAGEVQIIDLYGRVVIESPIKNSGKLSIASLDSGLYLGVFRLGTGEVYTSKFIVQ
ncbi:M20/M25/M40 family metallo-hydrolase [uncultured Weeksella sp.]|uniref:M20/M25/M40 family metallo-hydrolase n=1 Tax=uncultured Weeksella sp. TaxID=1161389 RepID=UPI00259B8650|nr:M20/M25/M40 family metallo-hydrolase [uncultured Weeksella sp.]